ncbi:hypothetical protein Tco_0732487 [Tanacetum coccineum]
MPRCLAWTRRKGFEKRNYPQLFGPDSNPITKLRPTLKELDENWCRKSYDYVVGFSIQAMSDSDENEGPFPITNVNVKDTSVRDDVGVPDAAVDYNAKDTSVCDDVGVPDAAAYYNSKDTSVRDDVGVLDAAADYNSKATSVHDEVGVPNAASDYNAKVYVA